MIQPGVVVYAAAESRERRALQWAGIALASALRILAEEIKFAELQIQNGGRNA